MMNKFGDYVLNEKEVVNVLYNNPNVDLTKLNITDVEKFNDAIANLYLANGKLEQYIEPNVSVEEFDKQYQQNWYMPQEYKELDIAEYLLSRTTNNDSAYPIIKFDGQFDEALLEELTQIDEIIDIKQLHV